MPRIAALSAEAPPDSNPKSRFGVKKVPLWLIPPAAKAHMAMAFADGAAKYGAYNWREHSVSASIYLSAAERHMDAWRDGEEIAPDSLVHHLGHVMACMAILVDAIECGKLVDDRPAPGPAASVLDRLKRE